MRVALLLPLLAMAAPGEAATVRGKTALLDFRYDWPAVAAAIPRLDARKIGRAHV